MKPVYAPPQLFPIGNETITYIATDHSGNQANCSFAVTVVGELVPTALLECVCVKCLIFVVDLSNPRAIFEGIFHTHSRLRSFFTRIKTQSFQTVNSESLYSELWLHKS